MLLLAKLLLVMVIIVLSVLLLFVESQHSGDFNNNNNDNDKHDYRYPRYPSLVDLLGFYLHLAVTVSFAFRSIPALALPFESERKKASDSVRLTSFRGLLFCLSPEFGKR